MVKDFVFNLPLTAKFGLGCDLRRPLTRCARSTLERLLKLPFRLKLAERRTIVVDLYEIRIRAPSVPGNGSTSRRSEVRTWSYIGASSRREATVSGRLSVAAEPGE
jgi:hypothetical protein